MDRNCDPFSELQPSYLINGIQQVQTWTAELHYWLRRQQLFCLLCSKSRPMPQPVECRRPAVQRWK